MRKIAVALLGLTVTACGVIDTIRGKDDELEPLEPNPLPEIQERADVERSWSYRIGGGIDGLRPALGASTVYVAGSGGRVVAVDLESGSDQWSRNLDITISGGVGTGDGLVLVGGLDGEVVALDRRDGSEVWRSQVSSEVMAPPRAGSGTVIVRTIDGAVAGLSSTSGESRWNIRRSLPSLTLRGSSPPIMDQGIAVMGFADGRLAAVDMTSGAIVWEISVSRPSGTNEVERMIDVDASPLAQGNILYAASFQGNVSAFDLASSQQLWTRKVSSHTDLAADSNNLYVSDSSGRVHALDRRTGEEIWVQDALLRRRLSGPAVAGDHVVVGDYQGYLHVLDKSDGRLVGRRGLGERISVQPLALGDQLLVLTDGGQLNSVSIAEASE